MAEPPPIVDDGGLRWVRTDICRGPDLVDGTAWISDFKKRLSGLQESVNASASTARSTRSLRQTVSDGDDPQFWGGARDPPVPLRNMVLREMADLSRQRGDPSRGCGRRVRLSTGEDVIFWFNVGPPGPPRERVYVTDAHCPHQHVCLNEGELKDIEDIAGQKQCMVRCHRHNKVFDLRTGDSPGNQERLRTYPRRFEHGHWYVAVGPTPMQEAPVEASLGGVHSEQIVHEPEDLSMDVDPPQKRPRLEEQPTAPTPCRSLAAHMTVA